MKKVAFELEDRLGYQSSIPKYMQEESALARP